MKKLLIFVWSLAYNLSDFSGPTRNMKVPADIACRINKIHKPPYHGKVLTTGENRSKASATIYNQAIDAVLYNICKSTSMNISEPPVEVPINTPVSKNFL